MDNMNPRTYVVRWLCEHHNLIHCNDCHNFKKVKKFNVVRQEDIRQMIEENVIEKLLTPSPRYKAIEKGKNLYIDLRWITMLLKQELKKLEGKG